MQAKQFNFLPGGEKIQREGPLAGRAARRSALPDKVCRESSAQKLIGTHV